MTGRPSRPAYAPGAAATPIEQFIDRQAIGRAHLAIVAACALCTFIDGFDTQLITYLAPTIAVGLHLSRAELGPIYSAGLLGMALGSFAGGILADRVGRKPVILLSLLWFGLFSVLTPFGSSAPMLAGLRLLTGLGCGAVMPNAAALTAEYAPARVRATLVAVAYSGFSVGGAIGGPVTAGLHGQDWRVFFVAGGCAAVLVMLVAWRCLPESLRFLVTAGRAEAVIGRAARFIDPGFDPAVTGRFAVEPREASASMPVVALFAPGRALFTTLVWAGFLFAALGLYMLVTWLPILLQSGGVPLSAALLVTSMFQLGGLVASLSLGWVLDRTRPASTLAAILALGAVSTALLGHVGISPLVLGALVFAVGAFVQGGMTGLTAMTAAAYPTPIRSTGAGWALGVSRIGGILGPMIGAAAIGMGLAPSAIFELASAPVAVAAAAALLIALAKGP